MTGETDDRPSTAPTPTSRQRPLAVLWDADGVLQELPGGWAAAMAPLVSPVIGSARVEEFLRDAWQAELPTLTGDGRWTDLLPSVLTRWGLLDRHDAVLDVWSRLEAFPAAVDVVRDLRRTGVACYLATNQDVYRAGVMHEQFGYGTLFDGCFYSYELGAAKPSAQYFEAVLGSLGLAATQVLFVDDTRRNVEAASLVGLSARQWTISDGVDRLYALLAEEGLPVTEPPSRD